MTSTMRHPPQQFRIIQQEFGRRDKRPCPSSRKAQSSITEEDDEAFEDEQDRNSSHSNDNSIKGRKKPGRKPNPASPAVRKEQNRAAQRAFRDRKERHLQEMETTIKTLKENNDQAKVRQEQFKSTIETLQSENFYLREVVFSFENALNKTGNSVILQEVKAELYRRHYEKHATRKIDAPPPPSTSVSVTAAAAAPSISKSTSAVSTAKSKVAATAPSTSTFQLAFIPNRIEGATTSNSNSNKTVNTHAQQSRQKQQPSSQAITTALSLPVTAPTQVKSTISPMPGVQSSSPPALQSPITVSPTISCWQKSDHMHDLAMFNMNSEILYKAPPLFGQTSSNQPFSFDRRGTSVGSATSLLDFQNRESSIQRQRQQRQQETAAIVTENGLASTVYSGHVSVFDELQSSLFPPGTLQSIIHTSLATPQEIVNDIPLLDQLHDPRSSNHKDPVIAPGESAHFQLSSSTSSPSSCSQATTTQPSSSTAYRDSSSSFMDEDDDINEFEMATPTLGLDDGLKQKVIPTYRLQLEVRVLASAPPAVDPNIDPKIYALPHDSRIDLIPCPKLRAQMILQQNRYHIDDLCDLLIAEAKCHGHPLDPHSWQLSETFFERYGFLLGEEMLRHRNKTWPKKDD
ncbi:hypothetical protein BGZ83_009810 [Gryganskiella cystojenkinii]|nr:hypothetical protein BGZ83_009810 [Gryganskiella cystojenkinii]